MFYEKKQISPQSQPIQAITLLTIGRASQVTLKRLGDVFQTMEQLNISAAQKKHLFTKTGRDQSNILTACQIRLW